jgi:dipeptidyl aminopeptidase/acylaminoacyl peptidase
LRSLPALASGFYFLNFAQGGNILASHEKKTLQPEDLLRIRLVSDPQVSPDGKTVALVQTRLRKKGNDYASNIWLVPADGSYAPTKFTGSSGRDMFPRWSPDGTQLAFLSTRSGKPQVWIIPVSGGEARQVTRAKRGSGEFTWSADGKWVVFTTAVDNEQDKKWAADQKSKVDASTRDRDDIHAVDQENVQPGQASGEASAKPVPQPGDWPEDTEDEKDIEDKGDHAIEIHRVHTRGEGQGLLLRRTHLFIVPSAGGEAKQITEGDWDATSPRWSPDGTWLAYLANKEPDAELSSVSDIHIVRMSAKGTPGTTRRVTKNDHVVATVDWLPDSSGFAIFGYSRVHEGALATNLDVELVDLKGKITTLTPKLDRTGGSFVNSDLWAGTGELRIRFSADGQTAYFLVTTEGAAHVYAVPVGGGEPRVVVGGKRTVLNFGVAKNGIVFAAAASNLPCDLFAAAFDGKKEQRLTDVNRDFTTDFEVGEAQEFWLERPGGVRVQGWMIMPPGFDRKKKYPLIIEIHGGPHVSYGQAYLHEFQVLAAHGNIILFTNPRGSQGYGQTFSDAILNDWGGVDYDDLMACVDYAIAQGNVDEKRLGVAGGSYGGYMTAWVIGHTQRFRAAVASRAVTNLYAAWGSGDYTWALWSWEFEGTPQDRTDLYLERSPVTYVEEMHTPLLLTHAEDDYRVAIEQADELYRALKVRGRTVKMVRFPSGGHDISRSGKPSLRIERIEHIAGWFDTYMPK